ncbi:MAG: tyrosine-type recombinase/integrase [Patescibacteria group bacterium]|nr:tyrosine-type recombinase/integrase [Patescibacteria group bacterium]MDE2014932.1 tyrosine-type recombinase/integrase [Patescibacteria group bacterium]MDE2226361.1 tyrosine-type recombinase/integrase [Patescibacteria group bacterium]
MKTKNAFEAFLAYQEKMGMSGKTILNDRVYLLGSLSHSIHDIDIADLKKTDVAKVIEAGRSHGRYGAQRSVVVLRKFLKYLKYSGEPAPFRWQDIRIPSVPQKKNEYLTEEELEQLLDAIDISTPAGLRTRTLLEVLYATGMRIGEVIPMNRDDVDWEKKEAIITNVKSHERQKVYFSDRSLCWLKRYLENRRDDNSALFISGRARLVRGSSGGYIRNHLQELAEKLGIKKQIKHHLFRKTFVTHLLQRKADIMCVKDLARHRSERTTLQNYAGVSRERSKTVHTGIMNGLLE